MKHGTIAMLVLLLSVSLLSMAGTGPDTYKIGSKVENFTLMGVDGKPYTLYRYLDMPGSKGVLLMFVSWQCPVSNNCNERYIKIAEFCKKNGITFLGINPNTVYYDGPDAKVLEEAQKAGFNFPVLRDLNESICDLFAAVATPTAILIDTNKTLRYRGRIDNAHGRVGTPQPPITDPTLMNALNQFLAGKELSVTDVRSVGCAIKRLSEYYDPSKDVKY